MTPALPAEWRDFLALTKPRVMTLVVYTGLCGLLAAPVHIHPVLGFTAIRRGDVKRHRAWIMRGYAIGLGAGTQALTQGVGAVIFGPPNEISGALLMGPGWVINLAVAEWAIRRRPAPPARTAAAVVSHQQ